MNWKNKLLHWVADVDLWLKKATGEEYIILYHFLRLLLGAVILALAVGVVLWIAALVFHAVSVVLYALAIALPYLLIIAAVAALLIYAVRFSKSRRRREAETQPRETPTEVKTPSEPEARTASPVQATAPPTGEDAAIRQSLLTADQPTRDRLQTVLASLERFDHRLELAITPAHYMDLLGDNWVEVRAFVESAVGRGLPEVSTTLVEIVILYKRAQEVRWVPLNHDRIHAWWGEAARRRKWMAEMVRAATAGPGKGTTPTDAETSTGAGNVPPDAAMRAAPTLSVPPTLDDLLRYYEWISRRQ